jgi:hypothetical protein
MSLLLYFGVLIYIYIYIYMFGLYFVLSILISELLLCESHYKARSIPTVMYYAYYSNLTLNFCKSEYPSGTDGIYLMHHITKL